MTRVAFGPGGDSLADADSNGYAHLCNVARELAETLADPYSQGVTGVVFGPDGNLLATADCSGCIYVWMVNSQL